MIINGVDVETFQINCSHPGCHEHYGHDDPLDPWHSRESQAAKTRREEAAETRHLLKLAYLDLVEAILRGEGGREAYRRLRVASLHDTPVPFEQTAESLYPDIEFPNSNEPVMYERNPHGF